MILAHTRFVPAFSISGHQDQMPLCVYKILSINEAVGDCSAYVGIGPSPSSIGSDAELAALHEKIRAGGSKISEGEARSLFPEIDDFGLRYRR